MSIKTFMRNPDGTLDARDSLIEAASLMRFDRRACFLVKDRSGVIGTLTPADARAAGPSPLPTLKTYEHSSLTRRLTVADALRGNAIVVSLDATPGDVARALGAGLQRGAIVTDGADVVGVVTAVDLLGAVIEQLERDSLPGLARVLVAMSLPPSTGTVRGPRSALHVALEIARRHGARVRVLHVMRELSPRIAEGMSAGVDADVHRWRLSDARASLARLMPDPGGLDVRIEIRAGSVVDGVLGAAGVTCADLIVMGGRPGSPLVRAITRRAPCPVLVA